MIFYNDSELFLYVKPNTRDWKNGIFTDKLPSER